MMKLKNLLDIRVAVFYLILTAGIFGTPSLGTSDATAASSPAVAATAEVAPAAIPTIDATVEETVNKVETASAFEAAGWDAAALGGVSEDVFALALRAAEAAIARGDVAAPSTLTVIDFSRPSTTERMWVYDLRTRELLFHELVSHGRNSGGDLSTRFSNVAESNQSSLGLFRMAEPYVGKHGYSLRLDGLEKGINDRARERAIVIHGAAYVNADTAKALGRLGRSLGCPAVRSEISRELIDAVKEGGLLFAYAPQQDWLTTSTYLN